MSEPIVAAVRSRLSLTQEVGPDKRLCENVNGQNWELKTTVTGMSVTSKVVLWTSCGFTVATVAYVHIKQILDKKKLHEGVIRDVENQQRKKIENLYFLQQQEELKKILQNQERQDEAVALKLLEESRKKPLDN